MLHILGMILKIAGILLGSILGMILLLSLLILFVSIRYRVNGSYGEKGPKDLDVKARIYWLFSLIFVDIVYDDRGSSHKIRIFGIPIGRKRKTAVSKDTEEAHVIEKKDNTERTKDTKTVQDTKKEQAYIIWCIKEQLGTLSIDKPVVGHFTWIEENKRRDLDNICFAKKFILDALVQASVLADDNRKIVTNFTDSFEYKDKSKVIVELEEI